MVAAAAPSPIGAEQAALIEGPVSIIVGSRDAALRPHLMRAAGCRLAADRRRLTLLLPESASRAVLDDLRDNGLIAVVFSRPSSHRTIQLKGDDAVVAPCGPDDAALARRYLHAFVAEIAGLGFPAEVAYAILARDQPMVAVHFTVAAAFEQTPGPSAGEPIPASSR